MEKAINTFHVNVTRHDLGSTCRARARSARVWDVHSLLLCSVQDVHVVCTATASITVSEKLDTCIKNRTCFIASSPSVCS